MTDQEKQQRLEDAIDKRIMQGGKVQSQTNTIAVIHYNKPLTHFLFFISGLVGGFATYNTFPPAKTVTISNQMLGSTTLTGDGVTSGGSLVMSLLGFAIWIVWLALFVFMPQMFQDREKIEINDQGFIRSRKITATYED